MKLKGIGASRGIAISKVYILENIVPDVSAYAIEDIEFEQSKLVEAKAASQRDLERLRELTREKLGDEEAMIFDAHIHILYDPEIQKRVFDKITEEQYNASFAYYTVSEEFANLFEAMDNEYMKERATDVRDVARRVLSHLQGIVIQDLSLIDEEVIIVAHDLTPSETAQLNKKYVKGFITEIGGKTSHSAILARMLEIPAIVGVASVLDDIKHNDKVVIDGEVGEIILHPTIAEIENFTKRLIAETSYKQELSKYVDVKSFNPDGKQVEIAANIGSVDDLEKALEYNADGIGLFRTEFLFMNSSDFPTEEHQFDVYKEVLDKMGDKKVIIRTLDIGGDKELDYFETPNEDNPFLGVRAVRLCMQNKELFIPQLRALLRASVYGNLHIMFPMIAILEELMEVKELVTTIESDLIDEGVKVGDYKLGIMIEIPSAALCADLLATEVDFFSIGTNDLIQYTLASDRMNKSLAYLYQPFNPGVLRLIKNVIDESHKAGIWTGMCGEMAGDISAIATLVDFGIDELSMSSSSILEARKVISEM